MPSGPPPRSREPVLNLPGIVSLLAGIFVAIHALRLYGLAEETDFDLLVSLAFIPARLLAALDPERVAAIVAKAGEGRSAAEARALSALATYVLDGSLKPWTLVSYALLHGSWAHVLLNSVWLAVFGTPIARRCGAAPFLLLGAAGAVAGALTHALVYPDSVAPLIGASAAVSAWTAAATTFVFSEPHPVFGPREVHERPRETLAGLLRNRRVLIFLAVWFATNMLSGLLAAPLGVSDASIAWEAHIGGFLVGLLLFPLFDRRRGAAGPPIRREG